MSTSHWAGSQLALNVQLRDDATLENFLATAALAPLVALLEAQLEPGGEPVIFMHGAVGTGKSHLLQACCHRAQAPALYLPLAELREHPPEALLAGTESMALVCLDDIDAVQGDADWERALFHFFNRARDVGVPPADYRQCLPSRFGSPVGRPAFAPVLGRGFPVARIRR